MSSIGFFILSLLAISWPMFGINGFCSCSVYKDMTSLCKLFCLGDLRREMKTVRERSAAEEKSGVVSSGLEKKEANARSEDEYDDEKQEEEEAWADGSPIRKVHSVPTRSLL